MLLIIMMVMMIMIKIMMMITIMIKLMMIVVIRQQYVMQCVLAELEITAVIHIVVKRSHPHCLSKFKSFRKDIRELWPSG